jgi:ferredoxin, 2Fe-2S
MAKIKFIEHNGTEHEVEADNGLSVMQAAVNNGIPGIVAECGGACSCATCHVQIDAEWYAKVEAPSDMENEMLEFAMGFGENASRLSCQIKISDELDGLVVRTPESQY